MKHLSRREDFLKRTKFSKLNTIINEEAGGPFTNDIPWGDSLVGRLINSFIRKAKIGYNSTRIQPLLDAFRAQLDILISDSLSRETRNDFNLIRIKSLFHNIKQVCTNSITDEEKLDQLIGGHQGLWDQTNQNGGRWRDVLTQGMVVEAYNEIENELDEDQLRDVGLSKDALLDQLSIFIDNLRRLTDTNAPTPAPLQDHSGFATMFGNLVNRFSQINDNYSYSYSDEFIIEDKKSNRIKDQKRIKNTEEIIKRHKEENAKGVTQSSNGTNLPVATVDNKPGTPNGTNLPAKKETGVSTDVKKEIPNQNINKNVPGEAQHTIDIDHEVVNGKEYTDFEEVNDEDTNDKIKKIKELAIKCVSKKLDTTEEILKDTDAVGFIKGVATLNQEDLDYIKRKNDGQVFDDDVKKFNSSEEANKFKQQSQTKEEPKSNEKPVIKTSDYKEQEQDKNVSDASDSFRYNGGYKYIYETTGTASGATGSTASATASTPHSNVIECWNKFVTEGRIPAEMVNVTQREIDELERLTTQNVNGQLTINLVENPDPIIAITRIFRRANDIYFTPVIPSGRSGGKVSNKTFLEYEKLGGGASGASDANNPGYGPWAVKKLRTAWTDGVLAILEDQRYRRTLANITFIVPGSEDTFNNTRESLIKRYDSFMKVYEAEVDSAAGGQLGKDKKSHGQILFDFINDLLDNKTAANFDEQRRILLKKYFEPYGLKVTADKNTAPPIIRQPECDPKTIFWSPISNFDVANIQTQKGKFYAIPIVKSSPGNHEMIFLQILKRVTPPAVINKECYYTKFVFDNQVIVTKYKEAKHPDFTITTDWSTQSNAPQNVYYGIITKISNNKFSLFYANVANQTPDKIYGKKDNFTISSSGTKTGPNGSFAVCLSILKEATTQNQSVSIDTDFCGVLKAEKNNHVDNLNIVSNDPDFNEKLLTALVKKMEKEFTNP